MSGPELLGFTLDGRRLTARPGQSVAAALIDAGIVSWRTTRVNGKPRGLFCGIGVCYDCLITVDGHADQRACLVPIADGMALSTGPFSAGSTGSAGSAGSVGSAGEEDR